MSKKWFIIIIVFLTLINVSATVTILYQKWSPRKPPFERFSPEREIRQRLDITPEQFEQMEQARKDYFNEVGGSFEKYHQLQFQLAEEIGKDQPDTALVFNIVDSMSLTQAEIRRKTIRHMLNNSGFLKPEQRRHLMRMFLNRRDDIMEHPMMPGSGKGRHSGRHGRGPGFEREKMMSPDCTNMNKELMDSINKQENNNR